MVSYLRKEQLEDLLLAGKPVEQWLTSINKDVYTIIKWLRTDREKDLTYNVAYFESFDEGNEDFLDIYEFSLLDPKEPFGVIDSFDSAKSALDYSIKKYKALETKFVSAGIIQDEYKAYLESQK